jgi:hypothetical protein
MKALAILKLNKSSIGPETEEGVVCLHTRRLAEKFHLRAGFGLPRASDKHSANKT